MFRH
jgi:hypothetical protein